MRTTQDLRKAWPQTCGIVPLVRRALAPGVYVQVHRDANEAVQALSCVLQAHGYHVRPGDTGAFNCRRITGGQGTSLHAHGIAIDINWLSNPYRSDGRLVTDMPTGMVADVERIRTVGGLQVWRWGGHYKGAKDAMHFEVVATPAELKRGIAWDGVRQPSRYPTQPGTWPLLQLGDRGPSVRVLQAKLGLERDGIFGPATLAGVTAYQGGHGLKPDGLVGLGTWTALLLGQPPLASGALSPVKLPGG